MNLSAVESLLGGKPLLDVSCLPFKKVASGKVREIFKVDANTYLILATDRISAFDVILPTAIPGKGALLTQLSLWWFERTKAICPNHLVENHRFALELCLKDYPELIPYAMLVQKLKPLALEAICRACLLGTAWESYQQTGKVSGVTLPANLKKYATFKEPFFTPSTKAALGKHDELIGELKAKELVGDAYFEAIKKHSIELYKFAQAKAAEAGFTLADTKFEFGIDAQGKLFVMDELLTSDASRYLQFEGSAGGHPIFFDKQLLREYLLSLDWNQYPPGPALPKDIISKLQARYLKVFKAFVEGE